VDLRGVAGGVYAPSHRHDRTDAAGGGAGRDPDGVDEVARAVGVPIRRVALGAGENHRFLSGVEQVHQVGVSSIVSVPCVTTKPLKPSSSSARISRAMASMFCGVIRLLSILNSSTTCTPATRSASGTEARSSSLDAATTTSPESVGQATIVPPVVTTAICGPLKASLLSCRTGVP
jgi:hypothetical protein